jgi:hypothetical protein
MNKIIEVFKSLLVKLSQFFEENNKILSMNRLMVFLIIFVFLKDWWVHIQRCVEFKPSYEIVSIVFAAMGWKIGQKIIENVSEKGKTNQDQNADIKTDVPEKTNG